MGSALLLADHMCILTIESVCAAEADHFTFVVIFCNKKINNNINTFILILIMVIKNNTSHHTTRIIIFEIYISL
jgi:hypothetical protein